MFAVHVKRSITAAVSLTLFVLFILPSNTYSQSLLLIGGTVQTSTEATFFDDRTSVHGSGISRIQARTLTYPIRLFVDGRVEGHGPITPSGSWEMSTKLDRLYARIYLSTVDVTVGKQTVNWGVGYAFSPTDLFHPPNPLQPDDIRPGVLAAVLQIPVGPLNYWSVAAAEHKLGMRYRWHTNGTDWSAMVVSDRGEQVVGMDMKGDLGVGFVAAGAYRLPGHTSPTLPTPTFEGLIGADYSWLLGSLVWTGEYAFQSMQNGPRQHQTFQQLTYTIDEFTSLFGSLVFDLITGNTHGSVGLTTALGPQSELSVVARTAFNTPEVEEGKIPRHALIAKLSYAF